jgi:L-lactate dehydrogenase complex protein LldG
MNNPPTQREAILARIRSYPVTGTSLPEIDPAAFIQFDDPLLKFTEMLSSIGGHSQQVEQVSQVAEKLAMLPEFRSARQVASLVPAAVAGNLDLAAVDDPHDLAMLDWAIVPGEFMVAENGAIWIDGNRLPQRSVLFIAQYLAIVVSRDQIVHNMHQAYARIGTPGSPFGVFVAGPSKTADIEQSLVLGAHGCRHLHVFVTGDNLSST